MPRFLPPLNALRAFDAAGRHENFSRAADELGVSHSAISRHVRGLEHRLNVRLFQDQPRGVVLTPDGQRYLAYVSPALDQIAEATEMLRARPAGVLAVNSEPLFASKWLIPRLGEFQALHPEVNLRLDASDEVIDIGRYEADMAIRFRMTGVADPDAELLCDVPLYPYATPDLVARGLNTPQDLRNFTLLRDRKSNPWRDWFARYGDETLRALPEADWHLRASLAIEAAAAGLGVILAGAEVMSGYVDRGEMVRCFDLPQYQGSYFLVHREGASRSRASRAFQDWLLAESRDLRVSEALDGKGKPKG